MNAWQARIFRRHAAYRLCFLGADGELTPAAKIVLADLQKYSGALGSPTMVSPVSRVTDVPATMQRVGRAEVFFRVWRYLRLPINQLFDQVEGAEND